MRIGYKQRVVIFLLSICSGLYGILMAAIDVSISADLTGMQGATVDIPFLVNGLNLSDSLVAYQMKIRFDPTVLQALGATESGTMTAAWGSPVFGAKNDTIRVGGYTTNQPNKRLVPDDQMLVKLRFWIIGYPSSSTVVTISEIKFFNLTGEILINSKSNGLFTVTQASGSKDVDITLYPGWNLISFPVIPTISSLPEILQAVPVNYIIGYYPPGGQKTWSSIRPLNSLNALDGLHGYWMKLNSASNNVLWVSGAPIPVDIPLLLVSGWNLISYLPSSQDLISHSFASIDPHYLFIIKYQNGVGQITWARNRPLNPLVALAPPFGYWVKMDMSMSLVYPTSGYLLSKRFEATNHSNATVSVQADMPQACDFWAEQTDFYQAGDTIQAFDSKGMVCAETVVSKKNMFLISVPGDDLSTPEDEGAVEGEVLYFKINGDSTTVMGTSDDNDSVIDVGKQAVWEAMKNKRVELKRIGGTGSVAIQKSTDTVLPLTPIVIRNYPNPFNLSTTIDCTVDRDRELTVSIYDIQGRLIRTLMKNQKHPAGSYKIVWDATTDAGKIVSSGMYLCLIESEQIRVSIKMVLLY